MSDKDINVKIGADASDLNGAFDDAAKKVKSSTESMTQSFDKAGESAKAMSTSIASSVKGMEGSFSGVNKSAAELSKMLDVVRNTLSTAFKMDGLTQLNSQIASSSAQMKKLSDDAAKAGQNIAKTNRDTAGSFSVMNGALSSVRNALIAAFSVKEIADAADSFMKLQAQLSYATGTVEEGAKAFDNVKNIAISTRQSIEGIGAVYRRLSENATVLNLTQERVARVTDTVAKSMALGGEHARAAKAALIQLQQALSSGVLRGQEFNSVMEQAPYLARKIAEGMGIPITSLKHMAETGQITSDQLIKALEKVASRVDQDFAKVPITIGGAMENAKTRFVAYIGEMEKSTGFFSGLAKTIDSVSQHFNVLGKILEVVAVLYSAKLIGSIVSSIAAFGRETVVKYENAVATRVAAAANAQLAAAEAAATAATAAKTASTTANTVATAANTVAVTAGTRAAAASGVAIGMLGGPITAAITIIAGLTYAVYEAGKAFEWWGVEVKDQTAEAAANTGQNIDKIINKLVQLDDQLKATSVKTFDLTLTEAVSNQKTASANVDYYSTRMEQLDKEGKRFSEEGKKYQELLNKAEKDKNELDSRIKKLSARKDEVGTDIADQYLDANPHNYEAKLQKSKKKFEADVKKVFGEDIDKVDKNDARYIAMEKGFNDRQKDIEMQKRNYQKRLDGPKGAKGGDVGKADLNEIKNEAEAEIKAIKEGYKDQNDLLDYNLSQFLISYEEYKTKKIAAVHEETAAIIKEKEKEKAAAEALAADPKRDEASRTNAMAEVKRIQGDINVLKLEELRTTKRLERQYDENIKAFKDAYAEMAVTVKDAAGEDAFAERMDIIQRKFEMTMRKMGLNAGDAGYELAKKAMNIDEWKARLAEVEKLTDNLELQYKGGEAKINGDIARGNRDQFSGARELLKLKQQIKLAEAEAHEEALNKAIEEGKLTDKQIEQERLKIELLKNEAVIQNDMAQAFDKNLQSGLSTMLEDVIGKTKTLKQAFADMVQNLRKQTIKEVSEGLSKRLMGSFSEMLGMSPGAAIYGKDEKAPVRTGAYEGTKQGVLDAAKLLNLTGDTEQKQSIIDRALSWYKGSSGSKGIMESLIATGSQNASKVEGPNLGKIVNESATNMPKGVVGDLISSAKGSSANPMEALMKGAQGSSMMSGQGEQGGFFSGIMSSIKGMFSKIFSTDGEGGGIGSTIGGFFQSIFGKLFGGEGSLFDSLSNILSGFFQSVFSSSSSGGGGFFGGSGGGDSGGGWLSLIGSFFGGARAGGGPVSSGKWHIVGEKGPEVLIPNQSGTIVPNEKIGGGTNIVMNINTPDANSFRKSMGQIQAEAMMGFGRSRARYA